MNNTFIQDLREPSNINALKYKCGICIQTGCINIANYTCFKYDFREAKTLLSVADIKTAVEQVVKDTKVKKLCFSVHMQKDLLPRVQI